MRVHCWAPRRRKAEAASPQRGPRRCGSFLPPPRPREGNSGNFSCPEMRAVGGEAPFADCTNPASSRTSPPPPRSGPARPGQGSGKAAGWKIREREKEWERERGGRGRKEGRGRKRRGKGGRSGPCPVRVRPAEAPGRAQGAGGRKKGNENKSWWQTERSWGVSLRPAPAGGSPQGRTRGRERCGLRGVCASAVTPGGPALPWEGAPSLPLSLLPQVLKKKEEKE